MNAVERINELRAEAESAIAAAGDSAALEDLRVKYLGRKSELTGILRGIGELPADERGPVGSGANEARRALEKLLAGRSAELEGDELDRRLAEDTVDVTLPGTPPVRTGHLHLVTQTRREIEDIFVGLGYQVMDGPEVEHDYYNFTALNHPPGHPARMVQDTFYVDPASLPDGVRSERGLPPGPRDVLLRTHTSPNQVRAMETHEPPLFIIVPGTVYRRDTMDATHLPVFSQVEGLAVGDARFGHRCHVELFEKRKDRAFILVSHDPNIIRLYCERACVLHEGRIHDFPTVDDAYEFYESAYVPAPTVVFD